MRETAVYISILSLFKSKVLKDRTCLDRPWVLTQYVPRVLVVVKESFIRKTMSFGQPRHEAIVSGGTVSHKTSVPARFLTSTSTSTTTTYIKIPWSVYFVYIFVIHLLITSGHLASTAYKHSIMSFDPGLERKFKGMFSQKRLYRKLRKFQETHTLDNSDDESGENAEKRSTQQPEDKTSSTPQASDTSNKHSDQTTEETKKDPRIQQMDEEGRTRYVQRWWPRDPHGPIYGQGWPGGKMTSNGNPHWGATLLDFFATNRVPSIDNFVLFSSGSRLAAFTRRLGEKECAWSQAELEWADAEEDPKQMFPVDMAQLITSIDTRVQMRIGRSMPKPTEPTPEVEVSLTFASFRIRSILIPYPR